MDLKAAKEKVTCSLAGRNLEKIAKVRLFNAEDSADPATVDGVVSVGGGDSTSASVVFLADALKKMKGRSYSLGYRFDDRQ